MWSKIKVKYLKTWSTLTSNQAYMLSSPYLEATEDTDDFFSDFLNDPNTSDFNASPEHDE